VFWSYQDKQNLMPLIQFRGFLQHYFNLILIIFFISISGCSSTGIIRTDCNNKSPKLMVSAECRFITSDYIGALKDYRQATQQSVATKSKIAHKLLQHSITLSESQKTLTARNYLKESLVLSKKLGDKALTGEVFLYLGEVAYRLGDYPSAKQYMNKALLLLAEPKQAIISIRNKNNLGNTLSNLGEFSKAKTTLADALSSAKTLKNNVYIAKSLTNIAGLNFNLRQNTQAMLALTKAESIAIAANSPRLQLEVSLIKGAVFRIQSDFKASYREYKKALAIGNKYKKQLSHELGNVKRVTAELLIYTPEGKHQKNLLLAEKLLKDVLILHRTNPVEEGLALNHLGEIALQKNQVSNALDYFTQAMEKYRALNYPDGIGRSYINIGRAYNANRRYKKALTALNTANTIYARLEDREWQRVALFEKGLANERLGKIEKAEKDYKLSIDYLESIRGDVYGDQSAQELFTKTNAVVYERLVSLLMEKGKINEALEYIERSRLRALDEYLMQGRSEGNVDTPLGKQRNKIAKAGMILIQARQLRERAAVGSSKVRKLINSAAKDYQQKHRQAESSLRLGIKSVNMAKLKLPSDLAVITYFPTPKATYIIVSRGGKKPLGITIPELKKDTLRQLVGRALTYIQSGKKLLSKQSLSSGKKVTKNSEILEILYKSLISPIQHTLEGTKTLVLYPHDFLTFLPFESLRSPKKRYLIQDKRIIYLHSIDGESSLASIGSKEHSKKLKSVVVFADPKTNKPPLPHAKNEAINIQKSFPSSVVLIGEQATEKAFNKHWGNYDIVHVAAHAVATSQKMALFLTRGKHSSADGILTRDDISGLEANKGKTSLVVLSACETAIDAGLLSEDSHDPTATLGLTGLIHLFTTYHDVPSRIGSLWKVNDAKTATLMGDMYKNMAQKNNKTAYDAFRAAQLAMINRDDISQHPYFWAGFIYFGATK